MRTATIEEFDPRVLFGAFGIHCFRMQDIGKIIVFVGLFLVIVGMVIWRFPAAFGWMGRLPGDISVQKGSVSFYFPIVTCIVISLILTLVSWLLRK
jgi:Protein of unknown function (DUF2905)